MIWTEAIGIGLAAFGVYALVVDFSPWSLLWYIFVWYGYFLLLSALTTRPGFSIFATEFDVLPLFCWSIPFWFFFEAYNVVIQNWYYVFRLRDWTASFLFSSVAFATVLPACLVHARLVDRAGWFTRVRWRPLRVGGPLIAGIGLFGVLCTFLPLVFPTYAFWMTWGALGPIPELIAYRIGSPSILRDLAQGRPGKLLALIVGGSWAGLAWEGLNAATRCKWIYTVPGLEGLKLFEMPVLGFFGFPALALNAYPTYGLVCRVMGHRAWPQALSFSVEPWRRIGLVGLGVAVSFFGFDLMMTNNVRSKRPVLNEMSGLTAIDVVRLRVENILTPEHLARSGAYGILPKNVQTWSVHEDSLRRAVNHATLSLHKGMGSERAAVLMQVGIDWVDRLILLADPGVRDRVLDLGGALIPPISEAEVSVWLRAAEGAPRR